MRFAHVIAMLMFVVGGACAGWYTFHPGPDVSVERLGRVTPGFDLTDTAGQPRTLASYRGRAVVLVFGFTSCPEACPTELFKLAQVMKRLGSDADRVQVLMVTLDPERDSPEVLRRYVAAFDPRFGALTGTAEQLRHAAQNFSVVYTRVPIGDSYTIDHSTAIYLIGPLGHHRSSEPMTTSVAELAREIQAILADRST
ncbi:MAG TPA: SCO family protein [Candidatus Margulisiibacteriota bacterium]|nr:SCO family protein [Candidatus Margulisiibacteriota bacterium]